MRGAETMAWSRHQQLARCYLRRMHPTTNPFLTNSKKIRRSKLATNTNKHGRRSYLSVGIGGDSQSLLERELLRSKDRGILSYI